MKPCLGIEQDYESSWELERSMKNKSARQLNELTTPAGIKNIGSKHTSLCSKQHGHHRPQIQCPSWHEPGKGCPAHGEGEVFLVASGSADAPNNLKAKNLILGARLEVKGCLVARGEAIHLEPRVRAKLDSTPAAAGALGYGGRTGPL